VSSLRPPPSLAAFRQSVTDLTFEDFFRNFFPEAFPFSIPSGGFYPPFDRRPPLISRRGPKPPPSPPFLRLTLTPPSSLEFQAPRLFCALAPKIRERDRVFLSSLAAFAFSDQSASLQLCGFCWCPFPETTHFSLSCGLFLIFARAFFSLSAFFFFFRAVPRPRRAGENLSDDGAVRGALRRGRHSPLLKSLDLYPEAPPSAVDSSDCSRHCFLKTFPLLSTTRFGFFFLPSVLRWVRVT